MPGNLPRPEMWQSLPFGDRDAFTDFLGQHALWHIALDKQLRVAGGASYPSPPLGDGPGDESGDWHIFHDQVHAGEAAALGLSAPASFASYDLDHRDDFATWTWLHGAECIRLAQAAKI